MTERLAICLLLTFLAGWFVITVVEAANDERALRAEITP